MHLVGVAATVAVCLLEIQNLLALWHRWVVSPASAGSDDYTIIVPLYGHPRYFEHRERLEQIKERVLVSIDVASPIMDTFAGELEADGWHIARFELAAPSPPTLLVAALAQVTTTYAARLDADSWIDGDIGRFVTAMRRRRIDLCSTDVLISDPSGICQKMQALEYRIAMRSRHYRPWLTSGACFIGRTAALQRIYASHSMWTPGEDIETGRVAKHLRYRVRHAALAVYTDAPATWRALFRQRRLWWAGNFRHVVVNADLNIARVPTWIAYYLLLVYGGVLPRWGNAAHAAGGGTVGWARMTALLFVAYTIILTAVNWPARSRWMLVYAPYSFVQSMLMPVVGAITYVRLVRVRGYFGRYRFGWSSTMCHADTERQTDRVASHDPGWAL